MTGKDVRGLSSHESARPSADAAERDGRFKRTKGVGVSRGRIELIGHLVLCSNARAQHGKREQGD